MMRLHPKGHAIQNECGAIIPYGRQSVADDDIAEVVRALKSDYLTTGPYVGKFETEFAGCVGSRYAVAAANGTAALHLACMALGMGSGDEGVTTPMTFAASANCIAYVGATPVFADIDPDTWNISPDDLLNKITPRTKLLIPVHYTGLPCDMERIHEIAAEHGLWVVEDACHALGAVYKGQKIGNCRYSDMTVFSFHPVKHITTGEGGMITTNSKDLYETLKLLRTHGIAHASEEPPDNPDEWYCEMRVLGYNYRITDIQCALGLSQLKKLDAFVARRRYIAGLYKDAFRDISVMMPVEPSGYYHSYHLFVLKLDTDSPVSRKQLYIRLKQSGIKCQVHYIPVHLHPYYQKTYGYKRGDCPAAERHYEQIVSLPLYPGLSDDQVGYVIEKVLDAFMQE